MTTKRYAEEIPVVNECGECAENTVVKILPCQHKFCARCLMILCYASFQNNFECPRCRQTFTNESIKTDMEWKLECSACLIMKDSKEFSWCIDCAALFCFRCQVKAHQRNDHQLQDWESGEPIQGLIASLDEVTKDADERKLSAEILCILEPIANEIALDIRSNAIANIDALTNQIGAAKSNQPSSKTEINEELLLIAGKLYGIDMKPSDFYFKPQKFNQIQQEEVKKIIFDRIEFGLPENDFQIKKELLEEGEISAYEQEMCSTDTSVREEFAKGFFEEKAAEIKTEIKEEIDHPDLTLKTSTMEFIESEEDLLNMDTVDVTEKKKPLFENTTLSNSSSSSEMSQNLLNSVPQAKRMEKEEPIKNVIAIIPQPKKRLKSKPKKAKTGP